MEFYGLLSIGGLLYNTWGFSIPFWTTGALTLILAVLGLILMQHKDEMHQETSTLVIFNKIITFKNTAEVNTF